MSNGKGDTPRPILDKKRYDANWDRIFGGENATLTRQDFEDCIKGIEEQVAKVSYKVTLTKELAEYAEQIADITKGDE